MSYQDAVKLHNEDEVIVKKTGKSVSVVTTETFPSSKSVLILGNDGCLYHHLDVK